MSSPSVCHSLPTAQVANVCRHRPASSIPTTDYLWRFGLLCYLLCLWRFGCSVLPSLAFGVLACSAAFLWVCRRRVRLRRVCRRRVRRRRVRCRRDEPCIRTLTTLLSVPAVYSRLFGAHGCAPNGTSSAQPRYPFQLFIRYCSGRTAALPTAPWVSTRSSTNKLGDVVVSS